MPHPPNNNREQEKVAVAIERNLRYIAEQIVTMTTRPTLGSRTVGNAEKARGRQCRKINVFRTKSEHRGDEEDRNLSDLTFLHIEKTMKSVRCRSTRSGWTRSDLAGRQRYVRRLQSRRDRTARIVSTTPQPVSPARPLDRPSRARQRAHRLVLWGFLLCFASTTSGAVLHYLLDLPAPYGFWSAPKLFGVPGGLMMVLGGLGLIVLARRADPALGSAAHRGGEAAFRMLVVAVPASGLLLWLASGTVLVAPLLALHLATVLAFFLALPYSKMAHAPFRFAALVGHARERDIEAQVRRRPAT